MSDSTSLTPTPYAVYCLAGCRVGLIYLTYEEYIRQMERPDDLWRCPICRGEAEWSDTNYELMMEHDGLL